jgi:hypothetical protein
MFGVDVTWERRVASEPSDYCAVDQLSCESEKPAEPSGQWGPLDNIARIGEEEIGTIGQP